MRQAPARQRPADVLFTWPLLLAVVALVLNDHVLKVVSPAPLTGKLSDAAGLFLFPLLVFAAADLAWPLSWRPGGRTLLAVVVMTVGVFATVKLSRWGATTYGSTLGDLRGIGGLFSSRPVDVVADPTDLAMLPFAFAAWVYGSRFVEQPGASSPVSSRR